MFCGIVFLAGLILLQLSFQVSAQRGYRRIGANQVVIDRASHWRQWDFADGTVEIGSDGVSTGKVNRHTNAVLDIVDFLRRRPPSYLEDKDPSQIELLDGIRAGSNRRGVVNALDGVDTTYWEPAPPTSDVDLASQWWFTVDLGRLVIIERIVARFALEGEGDPFLLFDVLVSDGQPPRDALFADALGFVPVLQVLAPNKTERVFEVDLSAATADQVEPLGRFVQVVVHGSDMEQGQLVGEGEEGEAAHADLAVSDRGLVQHTKKHPDGREVAVSQDIWEALDPGRRGPVRYYRRERPRLAELEVWGSGDELIHGIVDRGGSVHSPDFQFSAGTLFDGDLKTFQLLKVGKKGRLEKQLFFDLGSWYWINDSRLVLNFRTGGSLRNFYSYRLDFSDGARRADGSFKWTPTAAFDREDPAGEYVESLPSSRMILMRHEFDLVKARFFRFVWGFKGLAGYTNPLAEVQLFGEGYLPQVELVSDPIELRGSRNLTKIEWEAQLPTGTQVVLQTKTGNVLIPDTLYFRDDGTLFGRGDEGADKYYDRAYKRFRGEKRVIFEEGPEWSGWSPRYEDPEGSLITSPSPREILKIQASLISDRPDTSATLKSIRLHFAEPVARRLLGEIVPTEVDGLGDEREFTLHVGVDTLEVGFDELLVRPPAGMVLGQDETARDGVRLYAGRASQFAAADDAEQALSELMVTEAKLASFGDSLLVQFPLIESGVEVVRLDFPGTLYSSGGQLVASLRSSSEGFWQRVDVGDATELVESNSLLVVAQIGGSKDLLQEIVSPSVFTPNGDGVNDEVVFEFSVVLVGASSAAQVEIYDLSGRRVRLLEERREVSAGRYGISWDGLDDTGDVVPTGLYAVQLGLDAVTEGTGVKDTHVTTTIAVAY